ncbi:pantetheine-phosphate adenylyltransferase [Hydrogenimonas cancrithermarum]|uniref:Phosphopantetheine adenylyltransferase n=1 Tax=Hydrogenimonas cancrithermarum TaxID=2993563 RepID=A0ABN6WSS7_9BACT|nr:pantetheine-phosphate adenylyltransferase [Hydrogenimonas cancrithermarum]BDY12185.1 phosphopantetheine adenylyltransferase [Hydrogenimonas cancrithermarum]
MKRVIYPGTFDPITNGHMDIIIRATHLFDEIIVAVAKSSEKGPMFSHAQRIAMAKAACKSLDNVKVEGFSNLLVDFCRQMESTIIIRGLRAVSDFEYELQMGYANASLAPEIETVYLMPSLENAFISSSVVRSILKHDASCAHLLPPQVNAIIETSIKCKE